MFSPQQNGVDDNNQQAENGLGQESARRQQVLRFALIICLLFLFLDSGNQGTGRSSPGNSSKNDFVAEVPLGDQYSAHIDYILQEQPPGGTLPMNATGLYRGKWESSVQSGGGDVNGNTFK